MMSHLPARITAPMLCKLSYARLSSDAWGRLPASIFLCRKNRPSHHDLASAQHYAMQNL